MRTSRFGKRDEPPPRTIFLYNSFLESMALDSIDLYIASCRAVSSNPSFLTRIGLNKASVLKNLSLPILISCPSGRIKFFQMIEDLH